MPSFNEEALLALQQLSFLFKRAEYSFQSHSPQRVKVQRVQSQRVQNSPNINIYRRIQPHRKANDNVQYINHISKTIPTLNTVTFTTTNTLLEYRHLIATDQKSIWLTSFTNELGRLVDGIPPIINKGTNTIHISFTSTIK